VEQLEDNLGALSVAFTDDQAQRLNEASAVELGFPHAFLQRALTRNVMFGDQKIEGRA
jgi:hypothetical protein